MATIINQMIAADPMLPSLYQVVRTQRETYDTFTMEILPAGSAPAISYAPGQFNMLYAFGMGESAISISGTNPKTGSIIHTIREVGTVTGALGQLKRGDRLGVRGPFGSSWPVADAEGRDVLIIAGGIGLAPVRPIIYHLFRERARYHRISLLYGARTPRDILYHKELERWRAQHNKIDALITVDAASQEWRGNVGVVTRLIARTYFDAANTIAYMCGPEIMMRFTISALRERGVPAEQIYLSMERNMKCAIGFCGHCQLGPTFVCKDGPVYRCDLIKRWFGKREI